MVSKLFRLILKIKNRILRQISRVAYEGQNVNFTSTISYFDAKDNLHTNSIKRDGIEDATVNHIVSNIIKQNPSNQPINLLDIGTGDGKLVSKLFQNIQIKNLNLVEPIEKFHNTLNLSNKNVEINWFSKLKEVENSEFELATLIGVAGYLDDKDFIDTLRKTSKLLKPGGLICIRSVLKHSEPELIEVSRFKLKKLFFINSNYESYTYKTIRRSLASEINLILKNFNELDLKRVDHLGKNCFLHVWHKK